MPSAAAKYVTVGRLLQSRAAVAELGAAAMQAQAAAGLELADFIVIAVEPGYADSVVADVERAAQGPDVPAAS